LKEILKGHKPQKATDDIYQRGGDVLIDPEGNIHLHHVGIGPTDRPPIDTIFQILENKLRPNVTLDSDSYDEQN
jgi:hypothetical protein